MICFGKLRKGIMLGNFKKVPPDDNASENEIYAFKILRP